MTRRAIIAGGEVVGFTSAPPAPGDRTAPGAKSYLLPIETIEEPVDPTRQVRTGPDYEIGETSVVERFTVQPRPLAERKTQMRDEVNRLRDQKLRQPFPFLGTSFDYDDNSQKRITGAGALAHIAITLGGKSPTDPRWHDGVEDFVWIAADNALVPMDAQTVVAFGQAAGAWESAHVFTARALKDAISAAVDHDGLDAIDIFSGWPGASA